MPHVISCPNCAKRYQVADSDRGKRVRCNQCGTLFSAATAATSSPPAPLAASDPLDPFGLADHSRSPAAPAPVPLRGGANPLGTPGYSAPGRFAPAVPHARNVGVSNPSGGPTDAKMRLLACGLLAFGIVLILGSLALQAVTGSVYLAVIGLAPLLLVLGSGGLISPNAVRAIGKYGGHLPWFYKAIGWGLIGLSMLLPILVMIGFFLAGFQTSVPRPRLPVRQGNPGPSAKALPSTAEEKAAHVDDLGAKEVSNAMKPRKGYPVSIAVPEHSLVVPPNVTLAAGTRLEACWSGKWNPITTLSENEDGSVNVRWDDFGADFDCSMVRGELIIRKEVLKQLGHFFIDPSADATPRPKAANESGSVDSKPKPLKSYPMSIAVPPDSQVVPAEAKLQPGTRLQACWSGKWNPITLLTENKDGTLTVRWDDFGAAYDCSMIRKELIIKKEVLD